MDDRAIAWTLDAMLMVGVMTGGIVYALETAPTGPSEETAASLEQAQLRTDASDVLLTANATGALRNATVRWNADEGDWYNNSGSGFYTTPPDDHPLRTPLSSVLSAAGAGYGISVVYQDADRNSRRQRMFYQGTPGAGAVVASHTVVLSDDTRLDWPGHDTTLGEVDNSSSRSFYAPDAFPNGGTYNIVQVRIIAWQT